MRFLSIILLSLCLLPIIFCFETVENDHASRNLQSTRARGVKEPREARRSAAKAERLKKLLQIVESLPSPAELVPQSWCKPHNANGPVIFAAATYDNMRRNDAFGFVGTARKSGYDGDIVLAVSPKGGDQFFAALREWDAIAYSVEPECVGEGHNTLCQFKGQSEKFSFNMIRYYLYQWWASKYDNNALVMIADFRDVFFQSNPFAYKPSDWAPPVAQMVIFQEAYPNKVIYRCPFNGGWIQGCYGTENFKKVKDNTVSCSGISIGTRDAILAYSYLMVQQLDPRVRYGRNTTVTSNVGCVSTGMDQGLHNWLVYSGQLDKYMDLKVYQQGEGPVNTVGAFFPGERAILKFPLETWKVVKGSSPNKFFYNWNGDLSPVIHQADRFLNSEFGGAYESHLGAFKDMNKN